MCEEFENNLNKLEEQFLQSAITQIENLQHESEEENPAIIDLENLVNTLKLSFVEQPELDFVYFKCSKQPIIGQVDQPQHSLTLDQQIRILQNEQVCKVVTSAGTQPANCELNPNFHQVINLNGNVYEVKAGMKMRLFKCGHLNSEDSVKCAICMTTDYDVIELK